MSLTTVGPTAFQAIRGHRLTGLAVLAVALIGLGSVAPAAAPAATQEDKTQFAVTAGSLLFSTVPALPTLGSVVLNGQAQTTNTTMTNIAVADATGSGSGWNVTVEGQSGTGKSAVFAAYCPKAKCGAESEGYIGGGPTLAANSLTLTSTGASFTAQNGTTGTAPTLQCSTACNIDHASAVKIISAAKEAGLGTYITTGFTATSLALATPTTLKVLPSEEVYRVNLLWTLSTGP
jgi:putative surface cell wall-binding protein